MGFKKDEIVNQMNILKPILKKYKAEGNTKELKKANRKMNKLIKEYQFLLLHKEENYIKLLGENNEIQITIHKYDKHTIYEALEIAFNRIRFELEYFPKEAMKDKDVKTHDF